MIIRNKQERSVQETDYQPDVREFDRRLASHEVAADQLGAGRMDQLSQLEASSIDILAMLREQRDEENERLDKVIEAHKVATDGRVEKLILIGASETGRSVEVQMEIPKDILLNALQEAWDKYATNVEMIKDMIREI